MEQVLFNEIVKNSFSKRFAIFDRKSYDYATTEDCLSNFKRVSFICDKIHIDVSKPEGIALLYIIMKIDRLTNLLNKGSHPKNESIDDTINDLQNYIDILRCLLYEKRQHE